MKLRYGSIIDFSDKDFPDHAASILLLGGCPFRCPYCYVPLLLSDEHCDEKSIDYFVEHFRKHSDEIEGVVISGGEPLQQANAVIELSKRLKEQGLLVKIETNGFYAGELSTLLKYVDYVAIDVKTKLEADAYKQITGYDGDKNLLIARVLQSLAFLQRSPVTVEVRTTIVPTLNDSPEIVRNIAKHIKWADLYVLQQFRTDLALVDPELRKVGQTTKKKLKELASVAKKYVDKVEIRTK